MKIQHLISWIGYTLFSVIGCFSQEFPQTEITNGIITSRMYLPDIDNGYYRATRFDWSGVMPYLEYDGHTYFGKWFENHDPKVHESVMGPVEEFAPIGYEEAAIGEHFLKIGVGTLVKKDEVKYNKFKLYEISNIGKWEVSKKSNEVEFKHILNSKKYAYEYIKKISLSEGKSEMVLSHEFTNIGKNTIETQVYNHNFFFIDSLNIGPGYVVKFPFNIEANGRVKGIGELAEIENHEIRFIKILQEGDQVYVGPITGYKDDANEYNLVIENKNTGAGVQIHCNRALSKLAFWAAFKTICPEPFINIKADPGETVTWKITYSFYTN